MKGLEIMTTDERRGSFRNAFTNSGSKQQDNACWAGKGGVVDYGEKQYCKAHYYI